MVMMKNFNLVGTGQQSLLQNFTELTFFQIQCTVYTLYVALLFLSASLFLHFY